MPGEDEVYTYEYIRDLIIEDVVAMAAFRAYSILSYNDGVLNEKNEIPFITSRIYPVLLVGYLVLSRIFYFLRSPLKTRPRLQGHVFVINSAATYRFASFVRVASDMPGRKTLLCTQPAADRVKREHQDGNWGLQTHKSLHGMIRISRLPSLILRAWGINERVAERLGVEDTSTYRVAYNLTFTELVKSASFRAAADGIDSLHTQSPSPYVLENVPEDRLYHYQHGRSLSMVDRPAIAGIGLTYFTWGPGWAPADYHTEEVIETIDFVPVGNPLFDEMLDRRGERPDPPPYDVLFLGQSHVLPNWEPIVYEALVKKLVEICERKGYDLAIKLHVPQEDASYYRQRGWEEYIVDYDITESILCSRITLTDCSSGFLESAVLGSPTVLTELIREVRDRKLVAQTPGVFTPPGLDALEATIDEALSRRRISVDELNECGLYMLGGTTGRIIDYVRDRGLESEQVRQSN